jgi:hypothetical protein
LRALRSSAQFHSAVCLFQRGSFTVQAALDPNLFRVGASRRAGDGVEVADLATLFKTKAAGLVSRCSEKDLYDLLWLFRREPGTPLEEVVRRGAEIDGGMTAEAALTSLARTTLRESACGFAVGRTARAAHRAISAFKVRLEAGFDHAVRNQPPPTIGKLIEGLRWDK